MNIARTHRATWPFLLWLIPTSTTSALPGGGSSNQVAISQNVPSGRDVFRRDSLYFWVLREATIEIRELSPGWNLTQQEKAQVHRDPINNSNFNSKELAKRGRDEWATLHTLRTEERKKEETIFERLKRSQKDIHVVVVGIHDFSVPKAQSVSPERLQLLTITFCQTVMMMSYARDKLRVLNCFCYEEFKRNSPPSHPVSG